VPLSNVSLIFAIKLEAMYRSLQSPCHFILKIVLTEIFVSFKTYYGLSHTYFSAVPTLSDSSDAPISEVHAAAMSLMGIKNSTDIGGCLWWHDVHTKPN